MYHKKQSLNLRGELMDLSVPKVMGILNVTPDSFFDGGAYLQKENIIQRAHQMINEGADMIDLGAYSSRPGAAEVSQSQEIDRLGTALEALNEVHGMVPISIDTFRSKVADFALKYNNVAIINDISAGGIDEAIYGVVAQHKAAYIAMHMQGTPQTMMQHTHYKQLLPDMLLYFSQKIAKIKASGIKDIIIDPGFGFSKDVDQNYQVLRQLELFEALECPILTGVSRKSMIYKTLNGTPDQALNGTSVLHTIALSKGTDILRVHDVKPAKECITLYSKIK